MVVCPFCRRETQLMRGSDGYAVCPLCHNNSAAAPQPAWQPTASRVEGKSPGGAAVRSWIIPGWGQGYVHGAGRGWMWFGIWVAVFIAAIIIEVSAFEGASALIMLPYGIGQIVHAYKTAKTWNAEHNTYPPKGKSGLAIVLIVFGAILGIIILSAVVFVLVSNLGDTSNEALDYSILQPPSGVEVLASSEQQNIGTNEYNRQDITLNAASQLTYSYVSEDKVPLNICLAYPSNENAFSNGQDVDCFFLESEEIQGKRTVNLPAGTYSVFTIGTYGEAARIKISFWVG